MPIEIKSFPEHGAFLPIISCLYCGKRITELGNVVWAYRDETKKEVLHFEFTHKECDDKNQAQDVFELSQELDVWLYELVAMTRVDLNAVAERQGPVEDYDLT
jgi:hypothetical protein